MFGGQGPRRGWQSGGDLGLRLRTDDREKVRLNIISNGQKVFVGIPASQRVQDFQRGTRKIIFYWARDRGMEATSGPSGWQKS